MGVLKLIYINKNTRIERYNWYLKHNSLEDNICRKNCIDVCKAFNNIGDK